eukprot:scaffold3068_cov401-Prasinococcus_capsulatus_cf.AAC.23
MDAGGARWPSSSDGTRWRPRGRGAATITGPGAILGTPGSSDLAATTAPPSLLRRGQASSAALEAPLLRVEVARGPAAWRRFVRQDSSTPHLNPVAPV